MSFIVLEQPAPNDMVCSFQPTFGFHSLQAGITDCVVNVATDPECLVVIASSQLTFDPTEWTDCEFGTGKTTNFTFPLAKMIPADGVYYWQVFTWGLIPGWQASEIRKLTVSGGTYSWRIASEIIVPAKNGVITTTEKVGVERVEKHTFKITFAPMEQTKRDALKVIYDMAGPFYFYDNKNNAYSVYWGECDRNIAGVAFPSKDREFGIVQTNQKTDVLRWSGTCILSEV